MVYEGMKLAVLGMGTVFIFLMLLIVFIAVASTILAPLSKQEEGTIPVERDSENGTLTAVITAALATFRADKNK